MKGHRGTGRFDHFKAAKDISGRIGQGFAIFGRNRRGQVIGMLPNQVLQRQHDPLSLLNRDGTPFGKCLLGFDYHVVEFLVRGFRDMTQDILRRWIAHGIGRGRIRRSRHKGIVGKVAKPAVPVEHGTRNGGRWRRS